MMVQSTCSAVVMLPVLLVQAHTQASITLQAMLREVIV
jgi:hypothetical protein